MCFKQMPDLGFRRHRGQDLPQGEASLARDFTFDHRQGRDPMEANMKVARWADIVVGLLRVWVGSRPGKVVPNPILGRLHPSRPTIGSIVLIPWMIFDANGGVPNALLARILTLIAMRVM